MKITNNFTYPLQENKNNPKPQRDVQFKGWAAAPIKAIYLQPHSLENFKNFVVEMDKKCKKYFKIIVQMKDGLLQDIEKIKTNENKEIINSLECCWSQDNKIFLEEGNLGIFPNSHDKNNAKKLAKYLHIKQTIMATETQGGNCYLGKKPNGETYAIVGEDALDFTSKKDVAESLGVSLKNLKIISQPNFHIDMVVRPLNYPYVLVGDPALTADLAKKAYGEDKVKFIEELKTKNTKISHGTAYSKADQTIKELKEEGFIPIRVPGLVEGERGVNFMNALVHQTGNGDFVYITNKTHVGEQEGVSFEDIFRKDLMSKIPRVKDIIFIDAKGLVQDYISGFEGGTHCMVCEKPDFKAWEKILKKEAETIEAKITPSNQEANL